MGQRRPRSVKEWKKETSLKNELGFLILNINVHQNSWRFPACAFQSNTCWNNSFEGNVTTVSKINSKRHYFSTSLTKTYCDSGMNSYWRRRRRGGSIVLVWYRQNLHNDQALKEANAKFPFSKVFLVVFESDRKNFILKLHHTENFCNDIVFFPDSGCPSLDVPFAAYNLGARHVFASVSVDHFDMEVQKVRNSCFRHGIYFHISVGTYSAKYLFSCTASFVFGTRALMPALADSSPTTIWEKHLRRGSVVPYQISEDLIREGKCEDDRPVLEKFIDWLARIYLPDGYPNSVTKDYLSYSVWRAIQNLASSIMGVFATEALLFGLGLGRKSTPATSAAISWVLKDGLGYIGKVFYGSIAGNQFDVDPKSWRLVADAVEDAGGVLEIVTPLFPGHFLLLASVANAMKGVAAMTGTATRHAIYKSLALRENQGDIATKGESQGVTCKMLGLGLGIVASSRIGQRYFALLSAYALGCFVHLFANWKSLSCIQFATLNRQRCSLALQQFLQTGDVPSPYEVSRLEKVVMPPWKGYLDEIVMGASVKQAFESGRELREALSFYRGCRYLLTQRNKKILIVFHENCRPQDVFQAFMQAHKVRSGSSLQSSFRFAKQQTKAFLQKCSQKGWNTQYPLMGSKPVVVRW